MWVEASARTEPTRQSNPACSEYRNVAQSSSGPGRAADDDRRLARRGRQAVRLHRVRGPGRMTVMQTIQRELSELFVDRLRPSRTVPKGFDFRRVESERLTLRVPEVGDYRDYCALLADPEAFRWSDRGPMTGEEVWSRLLRQAGHWALMGYG